jgi:hypothetical protein
MPMTPDEYAAKELNVPGYQNDAPIYAPDTGSTGRDPNIDRVLNGGIKPEESTPVDSEIAAMAHEYNFTLPLELRRAEVATQIGRANFWNSLAAFITSLVS